MAIFKKRPQPHHKGVNIAYQFRLLFLKKTRLFLILFDFIF